MFNLLKEFIIVKTSVKEGYVQETAVTTVDIHTKALSELNPYTVKQSKTTTEVIKEKHIPHILKEIQHSKDTNYIFINPNWL
jgi:hypothetical protein